VKDDDLPPTDDDGWGDYSKPDEASKAKAGKAEAAASKPAESVSKPVKPASSGKPAPLPQLTAPASKPSESVRTSEDDSSASGSIETATELPTAKAEAANASKSSPRRDAPAPRAGVEPSAKHPAPEAELEATATAMDAAAAAHDAAFAALHPPTSTHQDRRDSSKGERKREPAAAKPKAATAAESATAAKPPPETAASASKSAGKAAAAKEPEPRGRLRRWLQRDDSDAAGPPGSRRTKGSGSGAGRRKLRWIIAAVILIASAALVTLSVANHSRYFYVCHPKSITAEQGRLFPWGRAPLAGTEWQAIAIDEAYRCQSQELGSQVALAELFAQSLIDRAAAQLAVEGTDVGQVVKALDQALLLTRGDRKRRERVDRLRGDVDHRQAATEVQAARRSLERAAQLFDDAAAKRPIYANDSGAWAEFAKQIADELGLGPHALRPSSGREIDSGPTVEEPPRVAEPPLDPPPTSLGPIDAGPPPVDANPPARGGVLL